MKKRYRRTLRKLQQLPPRDQRTVWQIVKQFVARLAPDSAADAPKP